MASAGIIEKPIRADLNGQPRPVTIEWLISSHIRADATDWISALRIAHGHIPGKYAAKAHEMAWVAQRLSRSVIDYEAAARAAGWTYSKADGYWRHPTYTQPYSYAHILCGCEGIAPHEILIIGHYIVTSELADKLEEEGYDSYLAPVAS